MIENLTELLFLHEYYMYILYFIFFLQNNVRLFSTRLNIAVKRDFGTIQKFNQPATGFHEYRI